MIEVHTIVEEGFWRGETERKREREGGEEEYRGV